MEDHRLLIINADDFGRTPEISKGVLECAATGIVRSSTIMSNFVSESDISALADSDLSAGLHFNLTSGSPIALWPKDLIGKNGYFKKDIASDLPRELIEDEIYAQWDYLVSRGIRPTHIDSHHHVHAFATVFAVVAEFALRRGVSVRPCNKDVAMLLVHLGITAPAEFSDSFFGLENLSKEGFLKILDACSSDSLEIMCHPGYSSRELALSSTYAEEREAELGILSDSSLLSEIEDRGWRIGTYLDL
ncbi:ChbG/HpnK family deacetylase [bacterium]|nr:ChbG/HpnK family deacetylase [bacterium]